MFIEEPYPIPKYKYHEWHINQPLNRIAYDEFCRNIITMDKSIRFAGIANNLGTLITSAYREGLIPLMDIEETSRYAIQAVTRVSLREDFQSKLGKFEYSVGKYKNLIRAIRPFQSNDDCFYLLLSFDVDSNPTKIIEELIIPNTKR